MSELEILVSIVVAVFGVAMVIVSRSNVKNFQAFKEAFEHAQVENNKAIWKRIDENRRQNLALSKSLNKNYYDKAEIREYLKMDKAPLLKTLGHMENQLTDIKNLFETHLKNND